MAAQAAGPRSEVGTLPSAEAQPAQPSRPRRLRSERGNMKQPCKILVEIYPPVYEINSPAFARRSLTCPLKYTSIYVLLVL